MKTMLLVWVRSQEEIMVEDWKEPYKEGVVYYLHEQRVRGVLLWNTWGQVDSARKLIAEKGHFNSLNVIGRIPL
jgi:hypothetical protein